MTEMTKAERVREIVSECLFRDTELSDGLIPEGAAVVIVEGIVSKFWFHPERLEQNREKVRALIREIVTDEFLKSGGGGYTFLNLCVDRSGEQWADHPTMGDLVCLAIGLKMAGYCAPRDFWSAFPGGVPYVWFDADMPGVQAEVCGVESSLST